MINNYICASDTIAKNVIFNPYKIGLMGKHTHSLQTRVRVWLG